MFLHSPLTWLPDLTLLHLYLAVFILYRIRVIFIKILILCIAIHNIPWTMTWVKVKILPWPIRGATTLSSCNLGSCSVPKEFNMRRIVEYITSSMKKFQETQQSIKAQYKGSTSAVEGMHRYSSIYIDCGRIDFWLVSQRCAVRIVGILKPRLTWTVSHH